MKYCPNCGTQCQDNAEYCTNCGSHLPPLGNATQGNTTQGNANGGGANGSTAGIFVRSIPVSVILSILTCGIYLYYWVFKVNDEMNQISGDVKATTGGMVVLFMIITCGIYGYYWYYMMGCKNDKINRSENGTSGILFLILGIFGLGIVNLAIMQDTINKTIS